MDPRKLYETFHTAVKKHVDLLDQTVDNAGSGVTPADLNKLCDSLNKLSNILKTHWPPVPIDHPSPMPQVGVEKRALKLEDLKGKLKLPA